MTLPQLKILLLVFFIALCLPTSILVYQAYGQLKWEAFHQHQQLARELSLRIDARFRELVEREENRPFTDYAFLNVTGSEQTAFLQRSPLSQFPPDTETPGLLGYFQVDQRGQLLTPTLPPQNSVEYGISAIELELRLQQQSMLRDILGQNRLVKKKPDAFESPAITAVDEDEAASLSIVASSPQAASEAVEEAVEEAIAYQSEPPGLLEFGSLGKTDDRSAGKQRAASKSGKVADFKLEDSFEVTANLQKKRSEPSKQLRLDKQSRREKNQLPESELRILERKAEVSVDAKSKGPRDLLSQQQITQIRTFESEIEPLEFSLLDSGHFVLFRRVWNNNQRYVQGLLFEQTEFVDKLVKRAYQESTLAAVSDLILAHQGNVVRLFGSSYASDDASLSRKTGAELLYQTRLVAPFSELELIFSLARLPVGAGGQIILWSALILALVLTGGLLMLYRLGAGQIALAQQQQDFVSAVSHELKTPLTSIRMYGEMLREGWADESRKKTYYDFIFNESERLSRLINNVLQLARLSRSEQKAQLCVITVGELLDDILSRLKSQLDQAGFEFTIHCTEDAKQCNLKIDSDWFTQIMINLVDNAIKFSANSETKKVDFSIQRQQRNVVFSIRDYGPGIARDQMKKIFKLFYRSENELTRETVGTGIGLSLVQQLANAMQGQVDVVNSEPGTEFRISFVVVDQA